MAQLVARGIWDAEVAGSSPVAPTLIICRSGGMVDTLVLGTSAFGRAGSTPAFGTIESVFLEIDGRHAIREVGSNPV